MNVGDLEVLAVWDGAAKMPATQAFRGTTEEMWAPHRRFLDPDGMFVIEVGGFLVRGGGDRVVLIDAGIGRFDSPVFQGGRLLENLAAVGVAPGDVTDVLFTHLHFDHVGWATEQGEIVFPNATYRCDAADWAHFVGHDDRTTGKLQPIEGRLSTFEGSGTILPGIDTMAAPGHTPGSTIMVLSSGTERALLLGDVVHCPVELLEDEWAGMGDVDPDLARRTRVALARELEGTDVPVAAAHFQGMQFGRLLSAQGRRSWVFSDSPGSG
ncbi:MAG: MBL fold metallo-hydrolase [Acidimicrobiales bacterium]|nr:MBL fold metallo-hydrolase [Acidimicrobiales bacterium]MBO0886676.1 MBL fold metallo-hydrolase [Acidimicrobiales bacterium]MBO0893230.1 MBL fold metallo-hydrolase [Acidimicrobiales bacterium]